LLFLLYCLYLYKVMLDSCVAAAIGRGVGECFIVACSRRLLTVDDEYEMEIDMNAACGMRL
jgi:hypothetical protein